MARMQALDGRYPGVPVLKKPYTADQLRVALAGRT